MKHYLTKMGNLPNWLADNWFSFLGEMVSNLINDVLLPWQILFAQRMLSAEQATRRYGVNTLGTTQPILGAVLPKNVDEVQQIVLMAKQYKIGLYPISTGKNWGYGSATPTHENCLIIDLSLMNHILEFDDQLGLVTLEPGVTQQQLHQYLEEKQLGFVVPVTGAGENCSLLGNALERGYGFNPHMDHFAAVNSLEAVLPDGQIYRTPHHELGGSLVDKAYKWGIGPYLDGLFSQNNLGIVTSMTIALAAKPTHHEVIFFEFPTDESLISAINSLREVLQTSGMNMGTLKLTNLHRLLTITERFRNLPDKSILLTTHPQINEKLSALGIPQWVGSSAIYGNKKVVSAVKRSIIPMLKSQVRNLRFINSASLDKRIRLLSKIPFLKNSKSLRSALEIKPYLSLWENKPSDMALKYIYSKSGQFPPDSAPDPDQNGCGLIWFSPLVPMVAEQVAIYIRIVKKILIEFEMEPVLTLSSVSSHCFDSAVPIMFDRSNPKTTQRAHDCYHALFSACKDLGFLPYRIPHSYLPKIFDSQSSYWQLIARIKNTVDPDHLFAPGKYEKPSHVE